MRDLPLSRWIARGQTCSKMHIPLRSCWGGIWFQRKDRLQPYSRSYLPLGSNRNMRTAHGPSVCNFWVSTLFRDAYTCFLSRLSMLRDSRKSPDFCTPDVWFACGRVLIRAAADKMLRAAPCICEFLGTPQKCSTTPRMVNPVLVPSQTSLPRWSYLWQPCPFASWALIRGSVAMSSAGMEH